MKNTEKKKRNLRDKKAGKARGTLRETSFSSREIIPSPFADPLLYLSETKSFLLSRSSFPTHLKCFSVSIQSIHLNWKDYTFTLMQLCFLNSRIVHESTRKINKYLFRYLLLFYLCYVFLIGVILNSIWQVQACLFLFVFLFLSLCYQNDFDGKSLDPKICWSYCV